MYLNDNIKSKLDIALNILATIGGIMVIFFIFKETKIEGDNIRQYTKTKDSLEALIKKYKDDYKILERRAEYLDSIIKVKSDNVRIIKERFYIYRDREIKNPSEATSFVKKFIQE
jgi:ABC-type dipeptide/oligopeptide/nickel transport system permease component